MRLTDADHARVTAAVTAAEAHTDGEIVTIVARQSDAYRDVALHWSVLTMLLALALLALLGSASFARAQEATCSLVVDAASGTAIDRTGPACAERVTPASTFKVPLALIGFEAGILRNARVPIWTPRRIPPASFPHKTFCALLQYPALIPLFYKA